MWHRPTVEPDQSMAVRVVPMPSTDGSCRLISCRVALAAATAADSTSSRSLTGISSSSPASAEMATALATSPAAWPPCHRRWQADVGPRKPSPHSPRGGGRRLSGPRSGVQLSFAQFQNGLPDTDRHADLYGGWLGYLLTVEVGAVGRAEILDNPLTILGEQPGMPGGSVVIVEYQCGIICPAHGDLLVRELNLGPRQRSSGHQQLARAAPAARRPPGAALAGRPGRRRL